MQKTNTDLKFVFNGKLIIRDTSKMTDNKNFTKDTINSTLNELNKAIESLYITIDKLHETEKHLSKAKENLIICKKVHENNKIMNMTLFGIQSLDEKVTQLQDHFTTVMIENQSNQEIIIFQSSS